MPYVRVPNENVLLTLQDANTVLAGPASGPDGNPTFRALVAADIPVLPYASLPVTNTMLADMDTQTIKGRTTAGTGDPEDLTATQATAILNVVVGDSGSGGTKGLVPAAAAGDAAAGKFLKADGTFQVPSGGGGAAYPIQPLVQVAFDPAQDTTLQDLIDRAEALAASVITNLYGVVAFVGPNNFSAQTTTIEKNVYIVGAGRQNTDIGNIIYQATDATHSTRAAGIQDCTVQILTLQSSDGGVLFDPDFLLNSMQIANCAIGQILADRVNFLHIVNSNIEGLNDFQICESVIIDSCIINGLSWGVDDSASNLPTTYAGGSPLLRNCEVTGTFELEKVGGSISAYLQSINSDITTLSLVGDTDLRIQGGDIKNRTQSPGVTQLLDFPANSKYFNPAQSMITVHEDFVGNAPTSAASFGPMGLKSLSSGTLDGGTDPVSTNQLGVIGSFGSAPGDILGFATSRTLQLGNSKVTVAFSAQIDSGAPTVADNYLFIGGLSQNNTPSGLVRGLLFYIDKSVSATNYLTWTWGGGGMGPNIQDTGVAIDGNFHNFRIEVNVSASEARFYIDGTLVFTESNAADNIPTNTIQVVVGAEILAFTNFIDLIQDYITLQFTPGTPRGVL